MIVRILAMHYHSQTVLKLYQMPYFVTVRESNFDQARNTGKKRIGACCNHIPTGTLNMWECPVIKVRYQVVEAAMVKYCAVEKCHTLSITKCKTRSSAE